MLHIGISGPIAAGKSTLARHLQKLAREHGYTAEIVSFATGIREITSTEQNPFRVMMIANLITSWGWDSTLAHLAAIKIDEYMTLYPSTPGVKNRRLLQSVGNEVGREFIHPDFWIYRTQQLFLQYNHGVIDYGISDDLRFNNEAYAVDVHVRISLPNDRIECYRQRIQQFDPSYTFNKHASETSLSTPALLTIPACFTDTEVQQLYEKLDKIRRIRNGRKYYGA